MLGLGARPCTLPDPAALTGAMQRGDVTVHHRPGLPGTTGGGRGTEASAFWLRSREVFVMIMKC